MPGYPPSGRESDGNGRSVASGRIAPWCRNDSLLQGHNDEGFLVEKRNTILWVLMAAVLAMAGTSIGAGSDDIADRKSTPHWSEIHLRHAPGGNPGQAGRMPKVRYGAGPA